MILACTILFSPLLSFLLALLCRKYTIFCQAVTCLGVGTAFFACVLLWMDLGPSLSFSINLLPWIKVGNFQAHWGINFDPLSMVMTGIVTLISFLVHIYSLGYMAHDQGISRFMAYLSLFTFMMLLLVTAPNMMQLFAGWEGVGLASYLLIGFWHEKPKASAAAQKAFIVNRAGDMGLILGMCALYAWMGTLDFYEIFIHLPGKSAAVIDVAGYEFHAATLTCILLFIGVMGKSAQFGLHTWLPDAMEGPTPVSALIHAATMVTAGIFLVARLSPVFEYAPLAKQIMVVVGTVTAFFGATVALSQDNIKRIIAYSTCSQLGYMVVACGCSAYSVAVFHLCTHAFFKALLFLGAGSIIHSMSDEQDIKKMGGIYRLIPMTYGMMWIGALALSGIPFFAGYYSKEAILDSALSTGHIVSLCFLLVVVVLTAFYAARLLVVVFHGQHHADEQVMAHIHESPKTMLFPLFVLTLGSLFSGWLGWQWFIKQQMGFSWGQSISIPDVLIDAGGHGGHGWLLSIALISAVVGIALAVFIYNLRPVIQKAMETSIPYKFLHHKWYIDELYQWIWVRPCITMGSILWHQGDLRIIDRLGPDGLASLSLRLSLKAKNFQSGQIVQYAFVMFFGIFALTTICGLVFYHYQILIFIKSFLGS
ncbi:MAG: NADH-quinone oxidoreductase subunit L [Alphaproteobacteria bacterium]|nr:NADH-quinone oxidoreductase subunit L [Alphaproteobacteria bacterium]